MKSVLKVAFAVCLGLIAVSSARADIILDGFGTPLNPALLAVASAGGGPAFSTGTSQTGSDFLGTRTPTVAYASSTGTLPGNATMQVNGGSLILGLSSAQQIPPINNTGTYTLAYTNFGTLNLSGFTSVDLFVSGFDAGTPPGTVTATVNWTDTSSGAHSASQVISGTGAVSVFFGGQDRDQVTSISVVISAPNGGDENLSAANGGIRIRETPVPEPTSIALFGLATIGGGFWAARRRRQVA